MRNPGFQLSLVSFVGAILLALSGTLRAEPPTSAPVVQQTKVSPVARAKPQIIYHVRPASNYAATLHSQQKTQNNDLPIDGDMPTSLQLSRSKANADARAQQEAPVVERNRTRPKIQKSHGQRPPFSVKSKGHGGKGHGGKGHKH
jgi:hypothetical protein